MSQDNHETRTFTPEQSQAMFDWIQGFAYYAPHHTHNAETWAKFAKEAKLKAALFLTTLHPEDKQALATPQAEPASQPATGRYVAAPDPERPGKFLILDTKPNAIHWGMSQENAEKEAALYEADYAETLARRERIAHEAEQAAAALNADSTGQGG